MYYSSGNYEAFARPRKPDGVDGKSAWFVGSGLASLAGGARSVDTPLAKRIQHVTRKDIA